MRIPCPFCGERDSSEFSYLGAPSGGHRSLDGTDTLERAFEAVYIRENPSGAHEELWYHGFGCRSCVRVTRDTRTHEVTAAALAMDAV
jgi:sarcosine oxidase subunit delta